MFATEAILIRTIRLTDTSLIVSWFTEHEGLVKTVAKGALRPKSPFAGKLDLFFSGEVSVVRARKGDLHILREISVSHWRQGLRRQYLTTLMACYFCQLVEAGVEPGQCDVSLFNILNRALDYLDTEEATLKAMLHFEKRLAEIFGISGGGVKADAALRGHLGTLPATRVQLLSRLGGAM